MSVLNMWSVCDRCGINYKRRDLHKESTNLVVCSSCYDGAYDLKRHPQNRPGRPRLELKRVPDGRPQQNLDVYLTKEDTGLLLTEDNQSILVTPIQWNPSMSLPR